MLGLGSLYRYASKPSASLHMPMYTNETLDAVGRTHCARTNISHVRDGGASHRGRRGGAVDALDTERLEVCERMMPPEAGPHDAIKVVGRLGVCCERARTWAAPPIVNACSCARHETRAPR